MEGSNFWIDLIASLKKTQSKKQIQSDAKNLGDIKVPLVGTLDKSKTKAQLKQDSATLNSTINLTGKVNKKGLVTSVQQATQQAQTVARKNSIKVDMSLQKDKLINDIRVFGQQNTKLFKDVNMTAKYNNLLDSAKLASSGREIQNLRLQLSAMRSELKANNLAGLTLGDTFKKTFRRATELFAGTGGIMLLTRQLRQAWTEALELDSAYTDLIKVQNELTRSDYPDYLDRCNKKAQELATTQKALIESVTEFSKSGYTLTESNALSEQATVLSNVGDMNASDSAKAIISGVQAYDIVDGYEDAEKKAEALIDKYNEIGNTASITTAEIAQGVQSVGSVFADANTSVDEFIALLAAGNRQYQDADALALGLRTSALRIRGCTAELEEMGEETDGVITSTAKLEEKIKALTDIDGVGGMEGVSLLEADGETFRSMYDIFLDISKVYQDMADVDQSALLELISGKHRASAISAVLNNMSEAQEIYKRSLESSGSAQEEYDKYLQSSEAALNRFKGSMTETYQSVISGETVTGLLNCGNATLQFVNSLGLVESTLKGLVAISIVKAITTLTTAFKASAIQASNFGTALNTVKNMSTMARGTTEYTNALQTLKVVSAGLSDVQLKQVLSSKALSDADRIAILRTTGLTKAQSQAKLAQMGLVQSTKAQTTAQNTATASTFSLTAAVKGFGASLKAAFMSNPIGIVIMGLSMAIGAVTSAIDSANQKAEEARQKAKDAASEANTLGDEVAELSNKYLALSEAVKTDASAKEDLMTTQTELLKKLGLEGETIDDLTERYGSLSNAIKQASIDSLQNARIDLLAGFDAAREELLDVGADGFWGDNNIINATGDDAVKAFKELEKAGIIGSGSYGTGGGSLVLTGDAGSVEGILENYQKLKDAIEALEESGVFTSEELSENSLFEAIYARYSEMKEEVETYNEFVSDINENLAQELKLALQDGELPDTQEAFETFKQELIDTAIASEQFIGTEKEITDAVNAYLSTVPEFEGFYSIPLKNELDKVDALLSQPWDYTETLKQLDEVKEKFDTIDETYAKLFDKDEDIGFEDLTAINEAFSDLDGIEDYIKRLQEAGENTVAVNDIVEDLIMQYIDYKDILGNVTAENVGLIGSYLEEMGVVNGTQMAQARLEAQTYATANGAINLENATREEIQQLINLGTASETTTDYLYNLYLAKLDVTNLKINTNEDVNQIVAIARAAGASAQYVEALRVALVNLQNAQAGQEKANAPNNGTAGVTKSIWQARTNAQVNVAQQQVQDALQAAQDYIKNNAPNASDYYANYGGGAATQKAIDDANKASKDATEKQKDTFSKFFDWMERRIKYLSKLTEKAVKKVTDSIAYAMDNSTVSGALKKINKEMQYNMHMAESYQKQADSVGLGAEWADLIKGGGKIDFSTITDEGLANQIDSYQEYYDKAQDAIDATEELRDTIKEVAEAMAQAPIDKFASKIEKYEASTELLEAKVDNAISASEQNKYLSKQINNIEKTEVAYTKAEKQTTKNANKYSKKITNQKVASNASKSEKKTFKNLKAKVKSATSAGKVIGDKLLDKIYNYCASVGSFAWYENCESYNAAILADKEAEETLALYKETAQQEKREIAKEKFDNVATEYENKIQVISNGMTDLDNTISEIEARGIKVNANYYRSQKQVNDEMLSSYQAEKSALEGQIGNIKQGTEEWYEALQQIQDVKDAISGCVQKTYELNDAIRELHFEDFNATLGVADDLIQEQEFLQGLFEHEKTTDSETGDFTDGGLAKLGSTVAQLAAQEYKTQQIREQLDELDKMQAMAVLKSDKYGFDFNSWGQFREAQEELQDQWQESISAQYDYESKIADMVKERYESEMDMMQGLIESHKNALKISKDLYDYQREITQKTQDISLLQKQIAGTSGDTSQEGKANVQRLNSELEKAQQDLQDTEYEKYLQDQEDMLDRLFTEYEELLTKKMDDFQSLVQEGLATANGNLSAIETKLNGVSEKYDYDTEFKDLFTAIGGIIDEKGNLKGTEKLATNIESAIKSAIGQAVTDAIEKENEERKTQEEKDKAKAEIAELQKWNEYWNQQIELQKAQKAQSATTTQEPAFQASTAMPTQEPVVVKDLINLTATDDKDKVVKQTEKFIKERLKTKKKVKELDNITELNPLQEAIADGYDGKTLISDDLKSLAKLFPNAKYNGGKKGEGSLYKQLKSLGIPGFAQGGIVSVDDIQKQVKANGDSVLVSANKGEGFLTPVQTSMFQELLDGLPVLNMATDMMANLAKVNVPDYSKMVVPRGQMVNIVQIDNITLPNVTNYEEFKTKMFKDMQTNKQFEGMVRDMTINRISGGSNLAKNKYRF